MDMEKSDLDSKLEQMAEEHGYNCIGFTTADKLEPLEDVRKMCASDKCHNYDRSWSCPPVCGTVDDYVERFSNFEKCMVFETVTELDGTFDIHTMLSANRNHKKRMIPFADEVKEIVPECLFLGAGPCTICKHCAYPDEECRYPDQQYAAMEAAGLVVSSVCEAAEIPYYHGSDHIAYVSCVLY